MNREASAALQLVALGLLLATVFTWSAIIAG